MKRLSYTFVAVAAFAFLITSCAQKKEYYSCDCSYEGPSSEQYDFIFDGLRLAKFNGTKAYAETTCDSYESIYKNNQVKPGEYTFTCEIAGK